MSDSPRLRALALPWEPSGERDQPGTGCDLDGFSRAPGVSMMPQPRCGWWALTIPPKVAPKRATLGWRTQPLRGMNLRFVVVTNWPGWTRSANVIGAPKLRELAVYACFCGRGRLMRSQ